MNDTTIWQRDIDSGAAALLTGTTLTADQWQACADRNHGRTRDIYRRCAEIARFRQELE